MSRNVSPALEAAERLVPQLASNEPEHDRAGQFAAANIELLRAAGLLALNVPRSAGGFGETLGGTTAVLRTIAKGSPSTALMLMMHTSVLAHYLTPVDLVPEPEREYFETQRAWAWQQAVDGHLFGVANSEAGAGGDVKNSRAAISHRKVSGTKSFCSMGTAPSFYMAAARDASDRVEYYLVENDVDHVKRASGWDAIGMRSSDSVSLRFDEAASLGPLAYDGLLDGINQRHWSTLSFAAVFLGTAEALLGAVKREGAAPLLATHLVDFHLGIQASSAFLSHCVSSEPRVTDAAYRRLVRDCKLFVTKTLAEKGAAVFAACGGSEYRTASRVSAALRDLLAGPAVRPPLAVGFEEVWRELAAEQKPVNATR